MTTINISLDKTQYVKVNQRSRPLIIQSLNDSVRIVSSDLKPALDNDVFHILSGKDAPFRFNAIETDVWVLAITNNSALIITEEALPTSLNLSDYYGSQGRLFNGSYVFTGLGNNSIEEVLMQTGSIAPVTSVSIIALGDFQVWVFEAPTVTSNGLLIQSKNVNRLKSSTKPVSLTDMYSSPVISTPGEELITVLLAGGEKKDASPVILTGLNVKKANTSYLFRFQNLSGSNAQGTILWNIGE